MKNAVSAMSLPDLIATMKKHVAEDMKADDVTARELIEQLDFAWCCAERWRLEHLGLTDDELAASEPAFG